MFNVGQTNVESQALQCRIEESDKCLTTCSEMLKIGLLASFASMFTRKQVITAAFKNNRKVAIVGRSMQNLLL
jgi:mRNA degradation ribonuclease J1/J2